MGSLLCNLAEFTKKQGMRESDEIRLPPRPLVTPFLTGVTVTAWNGPRCQPMFNLAKEWLRYVMKDKGIIWPGLLRQAVSGVSCRTPYHRRNSRVVYDTRGIGSSPQHLNTWVYL